MAEIRQRVNRGRPNNLDEKQCVKNQVLEYPISIRRKRVNHPERFEHGVRREQAEQNPERPADSGRAGHDGNDRDRDHEEEHEPEHDPSTPPPAAVASRRGLTIASAPAFA
jgi:hypothetical protein